MVDYDRSSEFTPAQLDVLEDALEDLTILPEGASPEMLGRLESFREILGLTDEALPPIDVPEGLLDSVLEEARRSPAVEIESAAATAPTASLWQRLRRSMVLPGFALAATAALLIVVLKPDASPFGDMSEESGARAPAPEKTLAEVSKESRSVDAEPALKAEEVAAMVPAAAPSVVEKADLKDEDADDEGLARMDDAPPPAPYEMKKRPAKSKSSAAARDAGGLADANLDPEAEPEEELDAEDKGALRDLLQQADSDRQRGRCSAAVSAYSKLLGARGNEEGRALMGLGLCAEQEGDLAKAEGYYRRAKAINPALEALISAERKRLTSSSDSPVKKSAKKSAKKTKPVPKKASPPLD